jgi:hypothetical protein
VGKRIAIVSVILLICLLATMGYFLQQGRNSLLTDPYKAVSGGACIVIETVDLQSFMNALTTDKGLFGEIGKIKEFDSFNTKLKYLTDQLNNAAVKKLLNDGTSIISFHPTKKGNLSPLFSVVLAGKTSPRQLKEVLHYLGIKDLIENKINGISVIKIPFVTGNMKDTVYISEVSGLLLCSSSELVLEEAIAQTILGSDIRSLPGFSRVLLASGKNEDKIFVVFANLPALMKSVLATGSQDLADKAGRLAGTAGGDIYINEDGLVLSGYTESTDSSDILYSYKNIPPKEFQTYKILPSATVLFETFALIPGNRVKKPDSSVSQETADLGSKLRDYAGDEITRAFIDIRDRPVEDNTLIIYKLANRVQAEQLFLQDIGTGGEVFYFEPDDQIRVPVYKKSFKGLAGVLLPGFSAGFDESFFVFYDNYMIAGSSFVTISRFLYDNILNKTLANDLTYRDFESTLPSRSGYFFYCIPSKITDYLARYLKDDIIKALILNKNQVSKIQAAGYQIASSNGMIYNSLSVRFKEEPREESTTEWETLLDTIAAIKPFFFTNHTTGAKEIFIQDMKNNAYLINTAGRVLWKVPLSERITGTIYMIDYFRNAKYQLLFSGKNFIHLLDRNGNYVERYPVKLRSPATNSLALFDYDNNLNYRLFIAGEDKKIYSYDKTGNVVKGWNPFRTTGFVNSEICYFKVSGKDYIVASDETSVYFLDRTGNKRITLKEPVTRAPGSAMRLNPGSEPNVICTSPDGTVQQIYFDGTIRKFSLKKFSGDHSFDIFDVNGDGLGEYIFIDKGMLYLYDHNRTEIFSRDFGSAYLGGPISFTFSGSDKKIGVFDANKKLIYLIGMNGETMNGFPLRGASMFSIGKLSEKSGWHLIVGGTDRFLYNYKIETVIK